LTARAIAADRLLDRAFGKAPQAVGVMLGASTRKASDYSDDQLAAIIGGAYKQFPAPADDSDVLEVEADDPSAKDGNSSVASR